MLHRVEVLADRVVAPAADRADTLTVIICDNVYDKEIFYNLDIVDVFYFA